MGYLGSENCRISIDIGADGPILGAHSLRSLGATAFDALEHRAWA